MIIVTVPQIFLYSFGIFVFMMQNSWEDRPNLMAYGIFPVKNENLPFYLSIYSKWDGVWTWFTFIMTHTKPCCKTTGPSPYTLLSYTDLAQ